MTTQIRGYHRAGVRQQIQDTTIEVGSTKRLRMKRRGAFVYAYGVFSELPNLPGLRNDVATDVNDKGQIVGNYFGGLFF